MKCKAYSPFRGFTTSTYVGVTGSTFISSSGGVGGRMGSNKMVPVGSESSLVLSSSFGFFADFGLYLSLSASTSTGSSKSGCLLRLLIGSKLSISGDLVRLLSTSTGLSESESKSESSILPDRGAFFITGSTLATSTFSGGLHFNLSAKYFSYLGSGFFFGSATRIHWPLHSFHCF